MTRIINEHLVLLLDSFLKAKFDGKSLPCLSFSFVCFQFSFSSTDEKKKIEIDKITLEQVISFSEVDSRTD